MSSACRRSSASTAPTRPSTRGRFLINLKPRDERRASASDVIRRLTRETPGRRRHHALHAAGAGSDDRRDGQPRPIQIRAGGRQPRRVCRVGAEAVASGCSRSRSSRTSSSNFAENGLSAYVQIDRADRGAVRDHPGDGRQCALRLVRAAHRLDDLHPVEPVPGDPRSRSGNAAIAELARLDLSAVLDRANGQVPLSAIARVVRSRRAPLQIDHLGQFPSATVSFNLAPGASLGEAVDAIKQAEREIGLPASMVTCSRAPRWRFRRRSATR